MPGPNFVLDKAFKPTAVMATPFLAVKLGTALKETVTPAVALDRVVGISQESVIAASDIIAGRAVNVRMLGISRAQASAAIAIGDAVKVTAGGQMVTTVTANDLIVGYAMTAAAAANDFFDVFLTPGSKF